MAMCQGWRSSIFIVLCAVPGSSAIQTRQPEPEEAIQMIGDNVDLDLPWKFGALPPWEPTFDMRQSTIVMACNYSGFMEDDRVEHKFGIVDYDWSNAKKLWANMMPMDSEGQLVKQAIRRKAKACPKLCPLPGGCTTRNACPEAKVWVYRNLVKALAWYPSVRKKLEDPAYSGFFLKFSDQHVSQPRCDRNGKCSDFYHDQVQTPHEHGFDAAPGGFVRGYWDGSCDGKCDCGSVPCGEYLWDHRNGSMLQDFIVHEVIGGETGLQNPNIDGFFIDDEWNHGSPSEVHPSMMSDMGLSPEDGFRIQAGWTETMHAVHSYILEHGAFSWQQFHYGHDTGASPLVKRGPSCTRMMREICKADSPLQNQSLLYGFQHGPAPHPRMRPHHVNFKEDLAAFLLIRGRYAWLGDAWLGCHYYYENSKREAQELEYSFPEALEADYGVPLGVCEETHHGSEVFVRKWSKAVVELDCKAWKGSILPSKQ